MQSTSTTYRTLWDAAHSVEVKLDLYNSAGTTLVHSFPQSELVEMKTHAGLFSSDSPGVGGTISAEIDVQLRAPQETIPRMAMLRPYVRLRQGSTVSEWLPKGVYYLDTRSTDYRTQVVTIHGYDAMLKAEQTFFTINLLPLDYQMYDYHVLDGYTIFGKSTPGVLSKMGVELEANSRYTIVTNGEKFRIPIPSDVEVTESGFDIVKGTCWTCRELLGQIAACYCGNFCMDENGKLRLVRFPNFGVETVCLGADENTDITFGGETIITYAGNLAFVGQSVGDLDEAPAFDPYSSVTVYLGDGDDHYTWPLIPPSTGRNLRVDTKGRTSTPINRIASSLYGKVNGYVYRPYSAGSALLDPAAQLGDCVRLNGVEYVINTLDTTYDCLCTADIASPTDAEVDHEYPYVAQTDRDAERDYLSLDNRIDKLESLLSPLLKLAEKLLD